MLIRALRTPGRYFHGAPTRQQAKQIFWDDLKSYTKYMRTMQPNETELYVKLINGSEIHVIGLDRPERIEGQPWNGCHITEMGDVKGNAWSENVRPVLADTNGFAMLDGVPGGKNHYYEMALYASGGALPESKPIIGSYAENPDNPEWAYYHWFSSDVLPAAELEEIKKTTDLRTYRQEYEGSFESFEGLAYYTFGKHNLEMVQYDPGRRVAIGMDFNVDPMTATLGHIYGDTYKQFGEIYQNNSNTFKMRDEIKSRFKVEDVEIFPDSTGKNRAANADKTSLAILKEAGFRVTAKSINPLVKDRINNVNSFIMDLGEKTRYKVNPTTCPKTINDFNRVERLADGSLNKDQEKFGLVHISDALGYLISYNFPVVKRDIYIQH